MPAPLTWLHLSDIHFGQPSASYTTTFETLGKILAEDLPKLRDENHGLWPDLVLFTGDLGFSGVLRSRWAVPARRSRPLHRRLSGLGARGFGPAQPPGAPGALLQADPRPAVRQPDASSGPVPDPPAGPGESPAAAARRPQLGLALQRFRPAGKHHRGARTARAPGRVSLGRRRARSRAPSR